MEQVYHSSLLPAVVIGFTINFTLSDLTMFEELTVEKICRVSENIVVNNIMLLRKLGHDQYVMKSAFSMLAHSLLEMEHSM